MNRINVWVVVARCVQMCLAISAMALSIAILAEPYYYGSYTYALGSTDSQFLTISAAWASGGVVLFGIFGLFGANTRPDDIKSAHLYLLILFIDGWALALSVAAGTCLAIVEGTAYYNMPAAPLAACICAFLCMTAIVPLIARTTRLWWKRVLWTTTEDSKTRCFHNTSSQGPQTSFPAPAQVQQPQSRQSYETDGDVEKHAYEAAPSHERSPSYRSIIKGKSGA